MGPEVTSKNIIKSLLQTLSWVKFKSFIKIYQSSLKKKKITCQTKITRAMLVLKQRMGLPFMSKLKLEIHVHVRTDFENQEQVELKYQIFKWLLDWNGYKVWCFKKRTGWKYLMKIVALFTEPLVPTTTYNKCLIIWLSNYQVILISWILNFTTQP